MIQGFMVFASVLTLILNNYDQHALFTFHIMGRLKRWGGGWKAK